MEITIQESYDTIAKYFSDTRVYTWKWTDKFINNLEDKSFILDIGSGNGRNTRYNNHFIIGLDISFQQLKMNNKYSNDIHANMINIPFKNNTFNSIICIASFHHLKNEIERINCLKEMHRILNKNGKILLSVWSINQPDKTKRKFKSYGDTIVNWNTNRKDDLGNFIIIPRYYYIFNLDELKNLICNFFKIDSYYWDCGNEIFELSKL